MYQIEPAIDEAILTSLHFPLIWFALLSGRRSPSIGLCAAVVNNLKRTS